MNGCQAALEEEVEKSCPGGSRDLELWNVSRLWVMI